MALSSEEQLLLELINRTRLDPLAEAARLGIDLNAGLATGTISAEAKQVLAPNALLETAAIDHSIWMLDTDTFSHTGVNGTTPGMRATAAGYTWTGIAENIAVRFGTTLEAAEDAIRAMHDSLFLSSGHRRNMMNPIYQEVGLGQESGLYTHTNGVEYQAWMLTELFGRRTTDAILTGVAYDDTDNDGFYSVGEGVGGVSFAIGAASALTAAAGGYALQTAAVSQATITGSSGATTFSLLLDLSAGNVKLDLVDGTQLLVSGNATLQGGITEARLLGSADLDLQAGTNDSYRLEGNSGNNVLNGILAQSVTLFGHDGNDSLRSRAGRTCFMAGQAMTSFWTASAMTSLTGGGQ
jgi:Ca2+-binding RTX toxin-like protein